MTDLNLLKVSLTKHNAHKIARLLKTYPADQILTRLHEVQAEQAQAYKNLSVSSDGKVPDVWTKVQALGGNAIDALVLIGIIFSHHELINAVINASDRSGYSGKIQRGNQLNFKPYTNFVRVLDQLGFATKIDHAGVTFNFRAMFEISGLGRLVAELLGLKLAAAHWDKARPIADEAVNQKFHQVFGVSTKEFKRWLQKDIQPSAAATSLLPKDEEFFQVEGEGVSASVFTFKPGHTERAVEPLEKSASAKTKVNQLHNDIQNRLYKYLCGKFGASSVGTELDTGSGTTVDVVTSVKKKITFFEIKTSNSVRASIRQAIPQLLEYAYWPEETRAEELVIVSHLPITTTAERYIAHLRDNFKIPLSYHQFDLKKNELI